MQWFIVRMREEGVKFVGPWNTRKAMEDWIDSQNVSGPACPCWQTVMFDPAGNMFVCPDYTSISVELISPPKNSDYLWGFVDGENPGPWFEGKV